MTKLLLLIAFPLSLAHADYDPKVLTFRQVPATLSALTGVSSSRTEISEFFNSSTSRFPQFGNTTEVTTVFLMAQLSYASLYCAQLGVVERGRASADRWVYGSADMSKTFAQYSDTALAHRLITDLALQLWGRDPSIEEEAILSQDIAEWAGTDAPSLDTGLLNLCSTFLTTPALWMEARQ